MRILIASKHLEASRIQGIQKKYLKMFDPALLSLPINWGYYGARAHNQGGAGVQNKGGRGPESCGPPGQNTVKIWPKRLEKTSFLLDWQVKQVKGLILNKYFIDTHEKKYRVFKKFGAAPPQLFCRRPLWFMFVQGSPACYQRLLPFCFYNWWTVFSL